MKAKVIVEFDVVGIEDEPLTPEDAQNAAERAVSEYLSFFDGSCNRDTVRVGVDGYGRTDVALRI